MSTEEPKKGLPRAVGVTALALGLVAGGYGISSAANSGSTGSTTPAASTRATGPNGAFQSNEDPAHEAAESPEREAQEHAGGGGGPGHFGSNEDPAHEAAESPEREAQEHAGGSGAVPAPSTTPSQSGGTTEQ